MVKLVRNEMHVSDPLTSDKQIVDLSEAMVTSQNLQELCEHIHSHCHENDAILFKIHFSGAYMHYTYILSVLLTYRARWQYLPLPVVCIIDPDIPTIPTNYSKAFVWRVQLQQTGSISGALLMLGAESIKTVHQCITRTAPVEDTSRTSTFDD